MERQLSKEDQPPLALDDSLFNELVAAIDAGEVDGKQVDWAGWVARMLPAEIAAFFEKHLGSSWAEPDDGLPDHMRENQIEFKRFVEGLDPNRRYALVASEL